MNSKSVYKQPNKKYSMSCLYNYKGDRTCELCSLVNIDCYNECFKFKQLRCLEPEVVESCPHSHSKEEWVDCEDWMGIRDSELRKVYYCKLKTGYRTECCPNEKCLDYLQSSE